MNGMKPWRKGGDIHYSDVILRLMASQITGVSSVCSTVCSSAVQRKHQAPRHWPLWGESTGDCPHKGPVTRKMFPFDDVIMRSSLAMSLSKNNSNGRTRGRFVSSKFFSMISRAGSLVCFWPLAIVMMYAILQYCLVLCYNANTLGLSLWLGGCRTVNGGMRHGLLPLDGASACLV